MSAPRPLLHIVHAEVAARGEETRLERAKRLLGQNYMRAWPVGAGPRVLTPEVVAKLAADNEALRQRRGKQ